jgi:hypothetical protein
MDQGPVLVALSAVSYVVARRLGWRRRAPDDVGIVSRLSVGTTDVSAVFVSGHRARAEATSHTTAMRMNTIPTGSTSSNNMGSPRFHSLRAYARRGGRRRAADGCL